MMTEAGALLAALDSVRCFGRSSNWIALPALLVFSYGSTVVVSGTILTIQLAINLIRVRLRVFHIFKNLRLPLRQLWLAS